MRIDDTNQSDPEALALSALGWTLADEARAQRLLALTGLTPEDLRLRLAEPALLAAVIRFLEAHEPDLLACAEALGVAPAALVETRRRLEL
jgi:adenine/guanine phosphoribosyltransferase-like PRPP-binding protein